VGTKAEKFMTFSKRYLDQRAALELETQAELLKDKARKLKDKARKLRDLRYVGDTVHGDMHTVDMGKGELLKLPRCDIDNWY
jgi:hypothetical protein